MGKKGTGLKREKISVASPHKYNGAGQQLRGSNLAGTPFCWKLSQSALTNVKGPTP